MAKQHTVHAGDCISSIAFANGFFPETLWDHQDNAELAQTRASGRVLVPGDVVVIPDLRPKHVAVGTGQRHRFRRKGVPDRLEVVLRSHGQPRANVAYRIKVAGQTVAGATSEAGEIKHTIPPNAGSARIELETGEVYTIALGHLDPATEPAGARARLRNLGLLERGRDSDQDLSEALARFQARQELEASGDLDTATSQALRDAHGS